jgi:hypothetical protein
MNGAPRSGGSLGGVGIALELLGDVDAKRGLRSVGVAFELFCDIVRDQRVDGGLE